MQVAIRSSVPPAFMVLFAGVTARLLRVGGGGPELFTVRLEVPETAPIAAVIVVLPAVKAAALFDELVVVAGIVAFVGAELVHVACAVQFAEEPSLKLQVAIYA